MTDNEGVGSPIGRVLDALVLAGGPDGKGDYLAFCPAHDDRKTPNLRVREAEDGRVLLRCFAGCNQDRVLDALEDRGIGREELFPARSGAAGEGDPLFPPKPLQPCNPAPSKPMPRPKTCR